MSINGLSTFTSTLRIGGLASGLDTDQIVSDLMSVERMPLDRLYQKKQLLEWKRDDYRDITNLLRGFKDEYFNLVNSSSNMLSPSVYKEFDVTCVDSSTYETSTVVSAEGTANAVSGTHTIKVDQLATAAFAESDTNTSGVTADFMSRTIRGSAAVTSLDYSTTNKDFNITVDGTTYNINLTASYDDVDDLVNDTVDGLQKLVDDAAGSGKVAVSHSGSVIEFTAMGNTKTIQLTSGTNDALSDLNFTNGDSNIITDLDFRGKDFNITLDGVQKTITFDSTNANFASVNELITDSDYGLQKLVDDAFGEGKITVSQVSGEDIIKLTESGGASKIVLGSGTTNDALAQLKFNSLESNRLSTGDTLQSLKGIFNTPLTFDSSNQLTFTINNQDFTFDHDTTLSSMINQINSDSTAGVTLQYDDATDLFRVTSDQEGEGNNLDITDTGGNFLSGAANINFYTIKGSNPVTELNYASSNKRFKITIDGVTSNDIILNADYASVDDLATAMTSLINSDANLSAAGKTVNVTSSNDVLKIELTGGSSMEILSGSTDDALDYLKFTSGDSTSGYGQNGRDAEFILDGQSLVRSSNNFTINGITYSLLNTSATVQNVSLTSDADSVYDTISAFVEKYNEVIDTINTKLSEEYDRDYQPLTDEQKEQMTDNEIEVWEEKAKEGLLRNDSILESISYDMRKALFDSIENVNTSLTSIGISTGSYEDNGKLTIDETELKQAIQDDPDSIMNLFCNQSATHPSYSRTLSTDERTVRYNEEGIMYRLYDIIEDNISTFRDENGHKGILLERAGITGDVSEYTNSIFEQIYDYEVKIDNMLENLADKENMYYRKFTMMERAIAQMNMQSQWLANQFGSNN